MAGAEDSTEQAPATPAGRCSFSPLGLVAELPGLVPRAIERGRGQVRLARALGRFVIEQSPLGPPAASPVPSEPVTGGDPRVAAPPPPAPPAAEPLEPAVPVEGLALPDYDSLSASQVIPRLRGLNPSELEEVRRYEAAGRSRRTILSKIAQIQSSS